MGSSRQALFAEQAQLHLRGAVGIRAQAQQCSFCDCQHHDEPGCAAREAWRDTMGVLERRRQVSVWKTRSKGARTKTKRGEG